jgi:glutamyl-tRNA reductase
LYGSDNVGNVERAIRETVKQSQVLTYKGNDLTVDSIENLIVEVLTTYPRGLGGKKATIVGAGNLGFKLALKLVERGMNTTLVRRDSAKLAVMVEALNIVKPVDTLARAHASSDPSLAAKDAHLLLGLTEGTPVINAEMINALAAGAVVIDG